MSISSGAIFGGREIVQQLRRLAVELDHALRELVAHAGLDQNIFLSGANEKRVQSSLHVVAFVGQRFARPHDFGDHAEKCAAIERVGAVGKNAEFEVA